MPVITADSFKKIKLYDNSRTEQYLIEADDRNDTLTLEAGVGISFVMMSGDDTTGDWVKIVNSGNPAPPSINDVLEAGNTTWRTAEVGKLIVQDYDLDNVTKLGQSTYTGHGVQAKVNTNYTLKVTGIGTVIIDGTTALQLPVGDTAGRPGTTVGTAAIGQVRFNYELTRFEGYDGRGWNTLGGVSSIDGGTVIAPDDNAPILNFRANNVLVATMSSLNTTILSPGLVIPTGTTTERPPSIVGQIRFNTQNVQFEGYNGQGWSSLGGVRDIAGTTYIIPELEAGSNEHTLFFVTNTDLAATLDGTRLTLQNGRSLTFKESIAGGSETVSLQPPSNVTSSYTLKLPPSLGPAGSVLSVDSTGQLNFVNSDSSAGSKINVSELYGDDINDGFSRPVKTLKRALQIASGYVYDATFVYNEDVCRRDAGLIIDGLGWDLVTGSNWRSIKAGQTYYNATASEVITNQKTQTISAINFLKNKAVAVLTGTNATTVSDLATEVVDIITNGADSNSPIVMPTPSGKTDEGRAKDLLLANRDFLVAETIAWINKQVSINAVPFNTGITYDEALCRRDTGLILDAVAFDIALGTNYNSVRAGLAYQRASAAYVQSNQKTVTIEAIQYAKFLVLSLPEVYTDTTASNRASAAFDEIVNILQFGSGSADPLEFPTPTGASVNLTRAKDNLVANRDFMKAEVVAWLNLNYPSLSYNQSTCSRDVGYVVDAVCYDLIYGGNSASVFAAEHYFSGAGVSVLPANQRAATAAAFRRLSVVAQQVVTHDAVVVTSGNTFNQDLSVTAATTTQATTIDSLITYVSDAVTANSTSGLPSPTTPVVTWAGAALQSAKSAIATAKSTIIDGVIGNINTTNPFIYDSTKCARDTAFIVNSVAYDVIYGGNSQTRDAGLKYYSGVLNSLIIPGQVSQTAAAIDHLRAVAVLVVQNLPVTITDGNTEIQINGTAASNSMASVVSNYFASVGTIVSGGVGSAPTLIEPTVAQDVVPAAGKVALENAKERIADNVVAYSSNYKPNGKKIVVQVAAGNYIEDNPVIIPDNTSVLGASLRACDIRPLNANQDMFRLRNGAYFGEFTFRDYIDANGVPTHTFDYATTFDDPTDINTDRLGYINMPISKPVIFVSPYIQNVSILSFLGGNGAKVDGNLVETPNIPPVKELAEYPLSGPVPEQGKSFVANAFTMLSFGGTGWRIINDAYAQIVSCFQIFMLNGSYAQSGGYLSVTNSATNFGIYALRSSGYSPNAFTFDKGYVASTGTSNSKQTITALGFGRQATQDYVIRFRNPDYKIAYDLLKANRTAIQDATVAWIASQISSNTYPFSNGFVYDSATCSRDVGLIIDALGYDLMFGSNYNSVKAAMSYYRAQASVVVGVQKQATLDALAYLKTLVAAAAAGTSVAVARVNANMNTIIDIVDNGLGNVPAFTIPDPTGYDTGYYHARRLVSANKTFMVAEISAWINAQISGSVAPFVGFTYGGLDQASCERDVGYIVDAVVYDLTYGGNVATRVAASSYYSYSAYVGDGNSKLRALAVQDRIKAIIGNIAQKISITKSSGNALTQYVGGTAGSSDAGTFAQARIQEIHDTINTGATPTLISPSTSWVSTSLIGARGRLQTARTATQASVISWINTNYPPTPFTYNIATCYRDVGLIIDAVAYDTFTGGNSKSIEAGKSYYIGTTSANIVVNDQKLETVAAINYAKSLAQTAVSNTGLGSVVGAKFDIVTGALTDPGNAPVSVAFGNSSDITNSFKPASQFVSFDAVTGVNASLDTITVPLHGFINGQAIIYNTNGETTIPGLDNEQTYYVSYVDPNTFKLTFDEGGTVTANIRGPGTGTQYFYKNLQEFYVDELLETHNSYQELTLQAGSYNFIPGSQITGTTGASSNNAYVYSYDPISYKLVVSLNLVTVGASIIRNAFAANSTINSDNGAPAVTGIIVSDVLAINTLYSAKFSIQSTATGGQLTNLVNLTGKQIWLHRPSIVNSSGHTWEYAGSGIDYNALPQNGGQSKFEYEQYSDLPGRVYTSGTNELGDFKVGTFIKAENKTGNVSFTNKVSVAQLDALRLAVGNIVIDFISDDVGLGDNEPGGASNSRLTTQLAIRTFLSNRLGGFIDKAVSTNAVPGAVIQLNSSGQINPDLLPAVRTFNSAKSKGFYSRLSLLEEVPAYDFLNGDIVTEEYSTVQLTLSAPITFSVGAVVTQAVTGATGYLIGDVANETVITVASGAATFSANFNTVNDLTINGDSTPSTSNGTVKPNLVGIVAGNVPANFVLSNANEGQYLKLVATGTYSFTNGNIVTSANDNIQGTITSTRYGVIATVDNGSITPGTLYTPTSGTATYSLVPLTNISGTGTGATADITVTNGAVTSVDMRRGGTGYAVGDVLSAASGTIGGTGSGFRIPVTTIEKRLYLSLIGGERFTATLASPNFIADNNAPVKAITASGSSTKSFNAQSTGLGGNVDYTNSRITITTHGYSDGDPVKYVSSPNTAIDPLVNATIYYVKRYDANTIELYKDYSLIQKVVFTGSSTGTHTLTIYNVNVLDNSFYYPAHGLITGDPVRLTGTSLPVVGGTAIVTGTFFFIGSVTTNSFTIHSARSEALSSINGLFTNKIAFTTTGSGTLSFTKQNVQVYGTTNTSSTNPANWSPLSATTIDASSITGGVISTSRLAGTGSANNTTFLRGDSSWHTAVQSIFEDGTPITLTGSYTTANSKNYYYGDVQIDIEKVDSNSGDDVYTNLGVAKFRKTQFNVGTSTAAGEVFIKDGVIDAGTLDGLDSTYYLNPANLTSNVPVTRGGTNLSSYAVGDMLYASATAILNKLSIGTNNQILTSDGTKPVWSSSLNLPGSLTVTNTVDSTSKDTGTLVVSGGVGIEKNVYVGANLNVGSDLNVTGNVNIKGAITTINSTTVNVDDKNIELGSVSTITGLTGTISGNTVAGLTDTGLLVSGMKLVKTTGTGAFGGETVINQVINTTTITVTPTSTNTNGTITFDVLAATNATADGGGITLKGTTDKTFNWINSTSAWTSSEHMNIVSTKEYRIGGVAVLTATKVLNRTPGGTTSGDYVTIDATQTLTNKTLQDSTTTFQDDATADKKLQFQLSTLGGSGLTVTWTGGTGGAVPAAVTIAAAGVGYAVNDVVAITGGDGAATFTVATVGTFGNVTSLTRTTNGATYNATGTGVATTVSSNQARTLSVPPITDTIVGLASKQTLTNKTLTNAIFSGTSTSITNVGTFALRDASAAFDLTLAANSSTALTAGRTLTLDVVNGDRTIKLAGNLTLDGNLTASGAYSTTLTSTADTNVTLPTTGTLATLSNSETLTSKTLKTVKFRDSGDNHDYILVVSDLAANRNITLPLLTGNDTFAFLGQSQTFTNKTFTDASTYFQDEADNLKKMQFQLSGITSNVTRTLTINDVDGTIVTTGDTGSVTNTMLAGSIANAKLVNSSITVGTTTFNLGDTKTTIAGLVSVTSTGFTGALTGNADTATQVKTNSIATDADYYPTFVDSNNSSATAETVYTDAGIKYNPSTNLLTVANVYVNGNSLSVGGSTYLQDTYTYSNPTTGAAGTFDVSGYMAGNNSYSFRYTANGTDWYYNPLILTVAVEDNADGSWSANASTRSDWNNGLRSRRRFKRVEGLTLEYEAYQENVSNDAVHYMVGFANGDSIDNNDTMSVYSYNQTPANLIYHDNGALAVYDNGASQGTDYTFDARNAWYRFKVVLKAQGAIYYVFRNNVWNVIKETSNNYSNYESVRVLISAYRRKLRIRNMNVYVDTKQRRGNDYLNNVYASSVTAPTFTGALTGNASSASNADKLDNLDSTDFARRQYNTETSNLAVGWYTIAVNSGSRATAKFVLRDVASGYHQGVVFYASHYFGNNSDITVLHQSAYSTAPFRYIRIKEGGTYDGALLQIYIDAASSVVQAYAFENEQTSGWIMKNWIADATNPGDLSTAQFNLLTNVAAQVDLDAGGQGTNSLQVTGEAYLGGKTTQYRAWHDGWISFATTGSATVSKVNGVITIGADVNTDTNTITTVGVGTAGGVSGDVKLVAGTNVTISRTGQDITINSSYTDTNTWQANTNAQEGYVASGANQANKVWKTDASGNPAWRADADTVYSLPLAADGTRGGVQIGYTTDATNRNYAVQLNGEKMYVNVPWTDTDTNTWNANAVNVAGYVSAPTSANANKVWKTDASGNPGWRDDADTDTNTITLVGASGYTAVSGTVTLAGGGDTTVTQSGSTITISSATTAVYAADLAERYQADAEYEPGTVLMFGGEFEVTLAEDDTIRVAGIVSTDPAYLMNKGLNGPNTVAIALQGRVPCKVKGKVRKGDMMVAAAGGYARATDNPKLGAIIGKALENFDGDEGVIEVVVGRI